jgi:dihydroorotate dehydrogenase (NAD+) catalytic subunit
VQGRAGVLDGAAGAEVVAVSVTMATRVGALALANPVMAASGTYAYGLDLLDFCPPERLGAFVSKGLSPRPRLGNPTPRTVETAAGMMNSIGLQNIGVEAFCRDAMPRLRERGAVVVANVFGERPEEYVEVIARCEAEDGLAGYELNVSCPNVTAGGMEFGHDPALLERLTALCRAATRRPLWVKLSPNAPHLVDTARAAMAGGADALTLINTLRALAIDAARRRPVLGTAYGGLSGPAIKPIALRMVWDVHKALPEVPLVGIGGIETGRDAAEFLLAGASAVQVGTAIFRDPAAPLRILGELERFCAEHGVGDVAELIGGLQWG